MKNHKLDCQCSFCKAERGELKGKDHPSYGKKRLDIIGENNPAKRLEVREKISKKMKGRIFNSDWKEKLSKAAKKRIFSETYRKNLSIAAKNRWKNMTEKELNNRRKKLSLALKGRKLTKKWKKKLSKAANHKGENNPRWLGGISFEPYTPEFNGELKKLIRERDSNICQFCGKTREENNQELSINHINYIKEDCRHRNLIALCRADNAKANTEREKWQFFFETLQEIRGI